MIRKVGYLPPPDIVPMDVLENLCSVETWERRQSLRLKRFVGGRQYGLERSPYRTFIYPMRRTIYARFLTETRQVYFSLSRFQSPVHERYINVSPIGDKSSGLSLHKAVCNNVASWTLVALLKWSKPKPLRLLALSVLWYTEPAMEQVHSGRYVLETILAETLAI